MRKKLGVEKRDEFLKMFCHNKKERTGVPAAWERLRGGRKGQQGSLLMGETG
jgi:hypothetical protein